MTEGAAVVYYDGTKGRVKIMRRCLNLRYSRRVLSGNQIARALVVIQRSDCLALLGRSNPPVHTRRHSLISWLFQLVQAPRLLGVSLRAVRG